METRTCTACREPLPLTCFRKEHRTKIGYQSVCKFCEKEWRRAHRGKPEVIAQRAEYHKLYTALQSKINELSTTDEGEKFCPICELTKPVVLFHKAKGRKGGRASQCKACDREFQRRYVLALKNQVYDRLGHVCVRCGFSNKKALQIDHIHGGGNREHKEIKNAIGFLKKVVSDTEGLYQILCANCNWIKRAENKEEPYYELKLPAQSINTLNSLPLGDSECPYPTTVI